MPAFADNIHMYASTTMEFTTAHNNARSRAAICSHVARARSRVRHDEAEKKHTVRVRVRSQANLCSLLLTTHRVAAYSACVRALTCAPTRLDQRERYAAMQDMSDVKHTPCILSCIARVREHMRAHPGLIETHA